MKEVIFTNKAPAAIGPYSQAVKVGNLLFISGQLPVDPATSELVQDTIQAQAACSLTNIKSILEQAGGTMDNVVKTTVFLKNMDDFDELNRVYEMFFTADHPSRSAVQVAKLPKNALVEVEAIAILQTAAKI